MQVTCKQRCMLDGILGTTHPPPRIPLKVLEIAAMWSSRQEAEVRHLQGAVGKTSL